MKILVVCTANICRSPMGERVLAKLLNDHDVEISSAGIRAIGGNAADPTVRELMAERGWGDLSDHRSQLLFPSLLQRSNLILCMEEHHIRHILDIDPTLRGKTRGFGHWQESGIDDPVGLSRKHYAHCLDKIEIAAQSWTDKLKKMGLI